MDGNYTWYILFVAFMLDYLIGDPQTWFHPIRLMGYAIEHMEARFRKWFDSLVISGMWFAVSLIAGTWLITCFLIWLAAQFHFLAGVTVECIMVYYCISARALRQEASVIHDYLINDDLITAKQKLSFIVGRDVNPLDKEGTVRAAVETVAENLVDGVISPLFFAAIGGAPLAMAYKMINTLDSMVGYKNDAYLHFGKAAAKIDDLANYIPARLSVIVIAIVAQFQLKRGMEVLRNAIREGRNHSSPNSGYSEAAFAGALAVRLGGPNYYHGKRVEKPYIGTRYKSVVTADINTACTLMTYTAFVWLIAAMIGSTLL